MKNCYFSIRNTVSDPSLGFNFDLKDTRYCILEIGDSVYGIFSSGSHLADSKDPILIVFSFKDLKTIYYLDHDLNPEEIEQHKNKMITLEKERGRSVTEYKNKYGLMVVELPNRPAPKAHIYHPSKSTEAKVLLMDKSQGDLFKKVVDSLSVAQ